MKKQKKASMTPLQFIRKNKIWLLEILGFVLLLLFVSPFYLIVINTAKPESFITASPMDLTSFQWVSFKNNFNLVFGINVGVDTVHFVRAFFSSLIITSGSLITIGIFSGMAAWVLVRTKTKYSTLIFFLFLSGMVIPFQIVMLPLVRLLNNFESVLGIPMKNTYYGVILVYIGFGAPLSTFLFHGFIKSVPMDIEEAAIIDGCTKPQVFFKVILPILKPIFVTMLVLNGMWIWNDFLLPMLVIGQGNSRQTLPLAISKLVGQYVKQWGAQLTGILFASLPVIILFLFAQKYIIQGMTSGAIK